MTDIHCAANIVKTAMALNDCASEFEGNLQYCQEYLDALYEACEKYNRAKSIGRTPSPDIEAKE